MGSLELYDRQGGDLPEVTNVERGDGVIQMQRRRADQQVFERNLDALGFLLAFDASGQPCDGQRPRMYGPIPAQPLDERQPPLLLLWRSGAIRPVDQFGHRHYRKAHLDLTLAGMKVFEDL